MKMIKTVLLAGLFVGMMSCSEEATENPSIPENSTSENTNGTPASLAKVSGIMHGGAGIKLYVYLYSGAQPIVVDSTVVEADDSFMIEKMQNGYEFVGIGEDLSKAGLILLNNGDSIVLDGYRNNWAGGLIAKGSENSEAINDYFRERIKFTKLIDSLKMKLQLLSPTDTKGQEAINQQGMAYQAEFEIYKYDYIEKHTDQPCVYAAFQDIYDPVKDYEILKKMEGTVSKFMPNSIFSQTITQRVQAVEQQIQQNDMMAQQQQLTEQAMSQGNLAVGKDAPELNYPGLDGKNISLKSLKGKVVLLDFWASWCKPCRMENPNVVKLYNEYKDKGFTIYSYSLDSDKNKWAQAIQTDGLVWPNHVSDLKGWDAAGAAQYMVNSIPQTYLIGADGKILAIGLRGADLEQKLKEILG